MTPLASRISSELGHFATPLVVAGLLAATTGCVCIVRELEITRLGPAEFAAIIPAAGSAASRADLKQTVKLQYLDGTSVLFRGGLFLEGDSVIGDGLRAAPDALGAPVAVRGLPKRGVVGAVTFRERTNAGASVAASVAGTAVAAVVLGYMAAALSDALDRAAAEALGCALGGTCSVSARIVPLPLPGSRMRSASPDRSIPSPGRPPRGQLP